MLYDKVNMSVERAAREAGITDCAAVRITLANGLGLLGLPAPEKM